MTTQLDWNPNLGTITGRVHHDGQAGQWADGANDARVTLAGPVNAGTTTDSDGNYVFEGLPDGAYVVSVAGASPASQNVTVASQAPGPSTKNCSRRSSLSLIGGIDADRHALPPLSV